MRRQHGGFRQGFFGPDYELARFERGGPSGLPLAEAPFPEGFSAYGEVKVGWDAVRLGGVLQRHLHLSLGAEAFDWGRVDVDGRVAVQLFDRSLEVAVRGLARGPGPAGGALPVLGRGALALRRAGSTRWARAARCCSQGRTGRCARGPSRPWAWGWTMRADALRRQVVRCCGVARPSSPRAAPRCLRRLGRATPTALPLGAARGWRRRGASWLKLSPRPPPEETRSRVRLRRRHGPPVVGTDVALVSPEEMAVRAAASAEPSTQGPPSCGGLPVRKAGRTSPPGGMRSCWRPSCSAPRPRSSSRCSAGWTCPGWWRRWRTGAPCGSARWGPWRRGRAGAQPQARLLPRHRHPEVRGLRRGVRPLPRATPPSTTRCASCCCCWPRTSSWNRRWGRWRRCARSWSGGASSSRTTRTGRSSPGTWCGAWAAPPTTWPPRFPVRMGPAVPGRVRAREPTCHRPTSEALDEMERAR